MNNKKIESSIKGLVNIYTVVIGAALSVAVASVVDQNKGLESVTVVGALLFTAFVTTLFPFVQGALRHIFDAYQENKNAQIKSGTLVIDFLLLFVHALGFLILAILLKNPNHFVWCLVGILSVDVIWGVFAHFAASSKNGWTAESKWLVINFVFVSSAIAFLSWMDIGLSASPELSTKLAVTTVVACLFRTLVDYIWCRDFYFPK